MIFNVVCKSETGDSHKNEGIKNQDAFFCDYNEHVCCLCIADGAGSKKHSLLGAEWLVKDVGTLLMQNFKKLLDSNIPICDVKDLITNTIKNSLNKTSAIRKISCKELSSTLMFIFTDGRDYLLGHLGDGVILAQRSATVNVLSFPHNGRTYNETYLTTMPNANEYLRIERNNCGSINSFWIMTDGAMFKVFQDNFGLSENELTINLIKEKLKYGHKDDATFGFITWRKE